MVVSVIPVVQSMGIFLYEVENSVVSLVSVAQRDFLVLKHVLKMVHITRDGMDWIWLTCAREKIEEHKTDWMLRLGFGELLKKLISDGNIETVMKYGTMKVSIFL